MRVLAEKVQDQPEAHDDKAKRAEFSLPTWLVLNALEIMGFKVCKLHQMTECVPKKLDHFGIKDKYETV